jgi:hypothetical protein
MKSTVLSWEIVKRNGRELGELVKQFCPWGSASSWRMWGWKSQYWYQEYCHIFKTKWHSGLQTCHILSVQLNKTTLATSIEVAINRVSVWNMFWIGVWIFGRVDIYLWWLCCDPVHSQLKVYPGVTENGRWTELVFTIATTVCVKPGIDTCSSRMAAQA